MGIQEDGHTKHAKFNPSLWDTLRSCCTEQARVGIFHPLVIEILTTLRQLSEEILKNVGEIKESVEDIKIDIHKILGGLGKIQANRNGA